MQQEEGVGEGTVDFCFSLASGTEGHAARGERQSTGTFLLGDLPASEHSPVWAGELNDGQTGLPTLGGSQGVPWVDTCGGHADEPSPGKPAL